MASSRSSDRWRDWVMLVLAVWLFISPWVLGFFWRMAPAAEATMPLGNLVAASWNAWVLGVVIGVLAIWAIAQFAEWQDWINGILGIWLVVSPWVLGFGQVPAPTWDHVIVGLLVLILAAWEIWAVRQGASAPA
ncbi:MAG: SPW repeat protein [Geminicoccaceae bacterium]